MIVSLAKAQEAAKILDLQLEELTEQKLREAYRAKSKTAHPDVGGDAEQFARLSWSVHCLSHWLTTRPTPMPEPEVEKGNCPSCGGTGRVAMPRRGFAAPLTMACDICRGLGTIIPEESDHD